MLAWPAAMAGYSGTPLVQKLGIKPGHRVLTAAAPKHFSVLVGDLPAGARLGDAARGKAQFDVAVAFMTRAADLERQLGGLKARMDPAAGLWIAWPKRASGQQTDLSENVVRRIALEAGLVDVKVCAIDDVWSGLKLVIRLADRPAVATRPRRALRGAARGRARGAPKDK